MFLKLGKFFYIALIFYMAWFQVGFFQINHMSQILGIALVLCLIAHLFITKLNLKKIFPIELNLWIIFGLVVLVFGFINALYVELHVNSIFRYFQYLIATWAIVTISLYEKKIDFFIDTFILLALVSAITVLINPYEFGTDRITMGPENNPNTLGITMALGIGFILFKLDLKRIYPTIIMLILTIFYVYITILTGSRKSIISVSILIIFWIFLVAFPTIIKAPFTKKVQGAVLLIIITFFSVYYIGQYIVNSTLWTRLQNLFSEGDNSRIGMYYEALEIFKEFPLFGAGMQQYRVISIYDTYSHSTYAEALANTGIIGSSLYFTTYIIITIKLLKGSFNKKNNSITQNKNRIILVMFIMMLFLGIGIIHFYTLTSFIFFGIIISWLYLNNKNEVSYVKT